MKIIDLRSDTVTLPTDEMREAIFRAELGDDVYGEDPTVRRLEGLAAGILGKEAALLVASGTMGNLVSVLTHCGRGDEAILGDRSHIFLNEVGGISALGGVVPHVVPNQPDGTMRIPDVLAAIRAENIHYPRTRLLCLENTHNVCAGAALKPSYLDEVETVARSHRLFLHLDGARIFNAAVALKVDVQRLTRLADSVNVCLSKGLSAPVGSIVCGSQDFIGRARKIRKMLGGGMRQAGIIAAAGIVALTRMTDRIEEDHRNARRLAEGLADIPGLAIDADSVTTNILYIAADPAVISHEELLERLKQRGIRILPRDAGRFRMVTHSGIDRADIDTALGAFREILKSAKK
ncbi:MAG: L-allo-threonine aldolase [Syntrophaceae bacterium PtaU1.Bin231]|nr:MAG: L-allo-threonine aldolase [Syntrophaceae bacterium PtaU1.Bin231]